jgi:hypothetical protein
LISLFLSHFLHLTRDVEDLSSELWHASSYGEAAEP